MKTYVITLSFLEGDEPFVIDSELSAKELKDKIDTAINQCSWELANNFVDFGNDIEGKQQLFPIFESIQSVLVQTITEWTNWRRVNYYFDQDEKSLKLNSEYQPHVSPSCTFYDANVAHKITNDAKQILNQLTKMNKLILIAKQYIPYGSIPEYVYFESDKLPEYWNSFYEETVADVIDLGLNSRGELQHYSPNWDFEEIDFVFITLDEFLKSHSAVTTSIGF